MITTYVHSYMCTHNRVVKLNCILLEIFSRLIFLGPDDERRIPLTFFQAYSSSLSLLMYCQQLFHHYCRQQSHNILCSLLLHLSIVWVFLGQMEPTIFSSFHKKLLPYLSVISVGDSSMVMDLSILYGHLISRHPIQHASTLVHRTLPSDDAPRYDFSGIKCKSLCFTTMS